MAGWIRAASRQYADRLDAIQGGWISLIRCRIVNTRSIGSRVGRVLVGVSALALAFFGLYQAWAGSTAIIRWLQQTVLAVTVEAKPAAVVSEHLTE
jgi:hypothetical protein